MAGRLREAGQNFEILERSDRIANSWQSHYERLHLHTIKEYSALPHQDFPASYPQYVPREKLVEYYKQYAKDYCIEPQYNVLVDWIKQTKSGYSISSNAVTLDAFNVVVATGFNRIPVQPTWPGMDSFRGKILHSRKYFSGREFKGQRVLVIGFGNTGAELALDLLEQGASPSVSIRGKVNVVPRDFYGRPTQKTAIMLNKLPVGFGDWLGTQLQKVTIGNLSRWGIDQPSYPPAYQLRTFGKTPVIDVGTIAEIKAGNIAVHGGPARFNPNSVVFEDGSSADFDAVVLATGYRCAVEDFVENVQPLLNAQGVPKASWFDGRPGLYFLGFDAYSSGLLWSIKQDSGKILEHMKTQGRFG